MNTWEEITGQARSGKRMDLGCDLAEQLAGKEAGLVSAAMAAAQQAGPSLDDECRSLLEQTVLVVLRQAVLALASDDFRIVRDAACEFQQVHWDLAIEPAVTESAFDALRNGVTATFPKHHAVALDRFLKPIARFFIANAAVAYHATMIMEEAADELFAAHHEVEAKIPNCRRHMMKDYDRFLRYSLRGMLPGGEELVFPAIRSLQEAMRVTPFGSRVMRDALDYLDLACRRQLARGQTLEFFEEFRQVREFAGVSAEVLEKRAAILAAPVAVLKERHGEKMGKIHRGEEAGADDLWRVLEVAVYATHYSGADYMWERLVEFDEVVKSHNFGARLMIDAFQAMLEEARRQLSGATLARLEPVLHSIVQMISISADVAEHGEAIVDGLVADMEAQYRDEFAKFDRARTFVKWDVDNVLWAVRFSLLPGWTGHCSQMFDAFGDVVSKARFFDHPQMAFASYEALEKQIKGRFTTQSLVFFLPRWRQYRHYLELCVALSQCLDKVLEEARVEAMQRSGEILRANPQLERYIARDLRVMLFTCAQVLMPGTGQFMVRGMEDMWDAVMQTGMTKEALDPTFRALVKSVQKHLPNPHRERLVPLLERGANYVAVTCELAPCIDEIVSSTVEAAFAKYPDAGNRFSSIRRKAQEDFHMLLHQAVIAIAPGGEEELAKRMRNFFNAVIDAQFDVNFMNLALATLRKQASKHLSRSSNAALDPVLGACISATEHAVDLTLHEHDILDEALQQLAAKHGDAMARHRLARPKAQADMSHVLRHTLLLGLPGGTGLFLEAARVMGAVVHGQKMDPAMMVTTFDALNAAISKRVSRATRKAVAHPIDQMRDFCAIMAGLGIDEQAILEESLNQLAGKLNGQADGNPNWRVNAAHDKRIVLHYCAIGLLPGGKKCYGEAMEMLAIVASQLPEPMGNSLAVAFETLAAVASQKLAVGPVKEYTQSIRQTPKAIS